MMESSSSICFENITDLPDIDIDMEVKSEDDSDQEIDYNGQGNEFDMEFIIPERRKPEELCSEEPELQTDVISNNLSEGDVEIYSDSISSMSNDEEDVEDEPEVEIDEVTVQQELVEVAFDPSLLLYVKRDKKSHESHQKLENASNLTTLENSKTLPEQIDFVPDSKEIFDEVSPFLLPKEDIPSLPTPNTRSGSSAVTAALRKVKRKPHREPLEPLNQIECSTNNVFNSINNENNLPALAKKNCKHNSGDSDKNIDGYDSGNDNDKEAFCSPPSPCDSDSEAKEQRETIIKSPVVTKRKRGRPRLQPLDFHEKISTKRKHKNRKVRKKTKIKPKDKEETKEFEERIKDIAERNQVFSDLSSAVEEVVNNVAREISELNNVICDISCADSVDPDSQLAKENEKKVRKCKKEKKKPTIFDEVKMEYTVLNEGEPKEKPKRIRKRDKKSRELAALNKPESFDCTDCGRKFKQKSHLATHARSHIDIRNFKCNRCGNLFKTKTSLFFHMKTHSDAPFTCDKCNKTYPERRMLMRHLRVVHSSQNLYSCDQCGREFKSMNNLNLHYTLHTGIKPFSCHNCGKSFVYKSTYIAHMKGHDADNQFNCELCPKTYNSKAEYRRLCSHHSEARPWLCTVCGKGYPLKGTLKNHMKTHEPEKPYKCSECPKSFMKKQSFECHLKIHAGERPQFMCDQCSQSYFNVFALKRHYLKHTSERKFVCEVCRKAFWMKDALKVHMRTHSNVKMFPCVQCPKSFAHKHSLDAHLRTHLDVQPYSCNVCQKTFIHKYNLARHERQHVLASSMPIMQSSIVPSVPQPMPISMMMLPPLQPSHTSTTLHVL